MVEDDANAVQPADRSGEFVDTLFDSDHHQDWELGPQPIANSAWYMNGQAVQCPSLSAGLYIIATPIGNLGDITLRALNTLGAMDIIACEDTRVSRGLMQRYGLDKKLVPYHEHNATEMIPRIRDWVAGGRAVGLISDAGTPLISDPGYRLVRAFLEAQLPVETAPGVTALITALSLSGLPTDAFFFAGFLPHKSGERKRRLGEVAHIPGTLAFYETPHRITDALADCVEVFGETRHAVLARELTKRHEELRRLPLGGLLQSVRENPPRGEIVLLVAPPQAELTSQMDVDSMLMAALAVKSVSQAASEVAKLTGRPKKELYARALELGNPSSTTLKNKI